jgi:phosphopantothenoylcysteine decarboxylase / phosphopantothenate---cysteine ligase
MKKNILLGVCGGIAAYKSCELTRLLVKEGHDVKVVMTDAAARFVTPLTFQTLSNNPVYHDMFELLQEDSVRHIRLADWTDICVIAPLSAHTLSKIACGICDNLLTTVVCALGERTPVLLASAMNQEMWNNPIIQENTAKLKKLKKYVMLDPGKGELACGVYGEGRMPEPQEIFKRIESLNVK